LAKSQKLFEENVKKIAPGTLCWIQGRPTHLGGEHKPMWIILPPPYNKDNKFTMRQTPPGAIDNGKGSIYDTIQVLNGQLNEDVDIDLGYINFHVFFSNGKLNLIGKDNPKANTGNRALTVGNGRNQIPIELWRKAKSQGIKYNDFIKSYTDSS
jgi:hypothetical protein